MTTQTLPQTFDHYLAGADLRRAQDALGELTDMINTAPAQSARVTFYRTARDYWLAEMSRASARFLATL